jgi:hypothetical protein
VDALPIIVALDRAEQIPPRLLSGGPAALMNQLHLQRMEERLHRGIDAPIEVKRWKRLS